MSKDIMIDLETLGTDPGDVVLSIGMVKFDLETGKIGDEFYRVINLEDSIKNGLTISASTFQWWLEQTRDAQKRLFDKNAPTLAEVLMDVCGFIDKKTYKVWGNGSGFDLGLLSALFRKFNSPVPWAFWNERDVRTLADLVPGIKDEFLFQGTQHYAVDDCKHQIKYCCAAYKILKGGKKNG